jgi:1,4-alpha-glucan branching enzyme
MPRRWCITITGSAFPPADSGARSSTTDAETYGGSNVGNYGGVQSEDLEWMGRQHSILIHLPPLATVPFKLER